MCGCAGSITPLTPAGNDALQTSSWGRSEGENDDDVDSDESPPQSDDDVDTDDELQPCKCRDLHHSKQAIV